MTVKKRSLVLGSLFAIALAGYSVARYYSPSLVLYVVEQSLIPKTPSGTDPDLLHARFHAHISATPDHHSQMERLLRISENLEKVQHLTAEQLNELLPESRAR
jgi:hypothetical protein